MTRWKASAIHLVLSVLLLLTIAAVLVLRWYPPGLFGMAQADKLLLIIAGVDIVVGPLLTLVAYKPGKKSLKLDLTVIALLQIAAMAYGLSTVWQSRPVYLVGVNDRFRLVFANEIDPADLPKAPSTYGRLPWLTVRTVGAVLPADAKERADLLFMALGGKDIYFMPHYYKPYKDVAQTLLGRSLAVTELAARLPNPEGQRLLDAARRKDLPLQRLSAIPIASSRGDATMLLDMRDGRAMGPVAVDPWPVFNVPGKPKTPAPGLQ